MYALMEIFISLFEKKKEKEKKGFRKFLLIFWNYLFVYTITYLFLFLFVAPIETSFWKYWGSLRLFENFS